MTTIPLLSILGGALIGLSAVLLMAFHGRIAGISGILAGVLPPVSADWGWRAAFLAGAIAAPAVLFALSGQTIAFESPVPIAFVVVGGLLVGIGTYLGSGCTSGHGVCGIARLSPRSILATATFMAAAVLTVYIIRHVVFPS
jgi:uncharacterized membrane protein YedE/YeeE